MTNDIQLKNTVSTKNVRGKQKKRRIASLDRRKARSGSRNPALSNEVRLRGWTKDSLTASH